MDFDWDHCEWIGITCNSAGSIIELYLSEYIVSYLLGYYADFNGRLSQLNFSCFPNLENLTIQSFPLNGSIPPEISALSKLQLLDLSSNGLTELAESNSSINRKVNYKHGSASFIFRLATLVWVAIFTCDNVAARTGTFVTASALSPLQLEAKALLNTGWWDSSFWTANYSSDHCKWIGFTCNSAGSIIGLHLSRDYGSFEEPVQLSQLNFSCFPNLENLKIQSFPLNGSIPPEISALSKLKVLDLSSNGFTGSIPSEIGNLRNLVHLNISKNILTGTVPSTVGSLTNLKNMDLSYNQLSGPLPQEIGNLKNLIELNVGSNSLIGPIPSTLGLLTDLSYLDLSCNQFSSSIPIELTRLTQLFHLDLSSNKLSGTIPP
ncbi:hypothetical protein WN944_009411 [Citrus x changshan-huyou]|uniref:Leucine-rich repeat-containing N-terminal plant-type domain-containing protein n=1 Tax=Citrus x changshan-huyou TaxID=2935761 RepID=A0AAP0MW48_9ROSI